ncbi:hypothetical protein [uncultured Weissella sp.]|uniref:hypothetical protein n=1 Tax=Weissella viridescens TaxID=1629 RepID=UPI0027DE0325|nr:hypothetical protein [uncultured Weissella sp.]
MTFKQYDKELGVYLGESDLPTDNPAWGNTEVALPGEVGQGTMYIFDESIQMWRSLNAEQWQDYLENKTPQTITGDDKWRIAMIKQVAGLTQQNMALTKTVMDLTGRIMKLEKAEVK